MKKIVFIIINVLILFFGINDFGIKVNADTELFFTNMNNPYKGYILTNTGYTYQVIGGYDTYTPNFTNDNQYLYLGLGFYGVSQTPLYKVDTTTYGTFTQITAQNFYTAELTPNNDYIYYTDSSANVWKRDLSISGVSNGTDTGINSYFFCFIGNDMYYENENDSTKVYKRDLTDDSEIVFYNGGGISSLACDPNGDFITMRQNSNGHIYKKLTSDNNTANIGEDIITNNGYNQVISVDGIYLYYTNLSDSQYTYKKDLTISGNGNSLGIRSEFYDTSKTIPITNGECGTNNQIYSSGTTSYTGSFCSAGTSSPTTPSFPNQGQTIEWECVGSNSGTTASCEASRILEELPVIDGNCGSNSQTYEANNYSYTGSFCNAGYSNPTTPSFPSAGSSVSWQCIGSGGGETDYCLAYRNSEIINNPINGNCGSNQGVYSYSDTSFSGDFCDSGTSSPTTPSFPSAGSSVSWSCIGANGGINASCNAFRGQIPPTNGNCGSNSQTYASDVTAFSGDFCDSGTSSPTTPSFPSAGSSVSWSCIGANGGATINCSATRRDETSWGLDLSFISNGFSNLIETIQNGLTFSLGYTGFNFPNSLSDLFIFQLNGGNYTINTSSCENMINQGVTYHYYQKRVTFGYIISQDTTGTFQPGLKTCNITSGEVYYNTYNHFYTGFSSDFEVGNYPCAIYKTTGSPSGEGTTDILQLDRTFNYVTKTGNTNIVTYNSQITNGIRWFPLNIILFGFDFGSALNDFFLAIINFVIQIVLYPINAINSIYQDGQIFFTKFGDDGSSFCFWGFDLVKINTDPTIPSKMNLPSNIPYTSNINVGFFIIFITIFSFLFYIIKRK